MARKKDYSSDMLKIRRSLERVFRDTPTLRRQHRSWLFFHMIFGGINQYPDPLDTLKGRAIIDENYPEGHYGTREEAKGMFLQDHEKIMEHLRSLRPKLP